VWRQLLDTIGAEPSVELAYPTTRTYLRDPLQIEGDGQSPRPVSGERPQTF